MTTEILPALIQKFFTERLCTQMEASPNTIASYHDTFRLLLCFVGYVRDSGLSNAPAAAAAAADKCTLASDVVPSATAAILSQLDRLLTPEVKVFAFTHASNTLGTVNPAAALCASAVIRSARCFEAARLTAAARLTSVRSNDCTTGAL